MKLNTVTNGIYFKGDLVFKGSAKACSLRWAELTMKDNPGYEWLGPLSGMKLKLVWARRDALLAAEVK